MERSATVTVTDDERTPEDIPEEFYKTPKVASILGLSVETVGDWIKAGKIQDAKKINGYWYVPRSEVLRIVNERHG